MLELIPIPWTGATIDSLAVPVCEDAEIHDSPDIQELIAKARALPEFSGEKSQQVTLYDLAAKRIGRSLFVGIGPRSGLDAESLRVFAGRAVKNAIEHRKAVLVIAAPLAPDLLLEPTTIITALVEGACLGNHLFNAYRQKPKQTTLKSIKILVPPPAVATYGRTAARTEAICRAVLMAREWVSMPSNDKSPALLAELIRRQTAARGLKVQVMDEKQLAEHKFNALLAVAAGSAHPPRLVEMVYSPPKAARTVLLVGKGVTFDTGGINIKPSQGLETMKQDMAGAAAVAAAVKAAAGLKLKLRLIGITPLVENMPSGSATRPGDIVTTYEGKTVEIGNTDAEGRLILADAMAYGIRRYKPELVIDLATLTGACVVALGEKMAGLFTADDELAQLIMSAGQASFERCWRMPLPEDYKELLKSEFADLSNMSSSRYGGAITAALFLSEFAGGTRWAHIDIAGPAYASKGSDYCGPGGTGFGVRLLCHLLDKL